MNTSLRTLSASSLTARYPINVHVQVCACTVDELERPFTQSLEPTGGFSCSSCLEYLLDGEIEGVREMYIQPRMYLYIYGYNGLRMAMNRGLQ
jgi:hypothetical protein